MALMKLVGKTKDAVINLDSVAYASLNDAAIRGGSGISLEVTFTSGKSVKLHGDDARNIWKALTEEAQPKKGVNVGS